MADSGKYIGYPWATGRVVSQPRMSGSQIRVFSSKGLGAPGTLGTSPLPQIGTPIPGTNLVYVRPRLSQDELGGAGGSGIYRPYKYPGEGSSRGLDEIRSGASRAVVVHYTNPEYSYYRERRRSPSLGMGAAGQMGLTMDVPWQNDVPYFSVP